MRVHEHRYVVVGGVVHCVHEGVDGGVAHVVHEGVDEGVVNVDRDLKIYFDTF